MRIAQYVAFLGAASMAAAILYGLAAAGPGEVDTLLDLVWGRVALLDVYIGFLLFWAWIFFREQNLGRSFLWLLPILILGNFTTCLYVFLALRASGGDWRRFWLGSRAA